MGVTVAFRGKARRPGQVVGVGKRKRMGESLWPDTDVSSREAKIPTTALGFVLEDGRMEGPHRQKPGRVEEPLQVADGGVSSMF